MQKLAIIGANEFQEPLIRKAKEMGFETHVFAWAAGDVGEEAADVFHLFQPPKDMVAQIEQWRKNHTELVLMLTETPINADVYLETFDYTPTGGVGNIDYSISFVEARSVTVMTAQEAATTSSALSSNTASGTRPAAAATDTTVASEQTRTYTVKSGDCLWTIAKRFLGKGSRYTEIYEMNKSVIGANPNLIRPGQVYTLPAS